jgi:TolB-like protein
MISASRWRILKMILSVIDMSTTPDIFLSYNREDQAKARLFAEGFERAGFNVWWDVALQSGDDYDRATEHALRSAKAVVVLWSLKSVESRWVRTEATIALQNKTLVPVMIEPCQRPIMFELTQTAELSHWRGDASDSAWLAFVKDVQRFIQRATSAVAGTAASAPASTASPVSASASATVTTASAFESTAAKSNRKLLPLLAAAVVAIAAGLFVVLRDTNNSPSVELANTAAIATDATIAENSEPASTTTSNTTTDATTIEKSIAVLPFANLSSDPEQEYFSDGLSEELLNKLARVESLQVAARTSSFYFKGRNEDMRSIAEQLGVNYILEGSVRKAGNELRITAQLIQANNGFHLWSQTYDRNLNDIFAVQDEIAIDVTRALSITLRAGEFSRAGMTDNIEAYDLSLAARNKTQRAGVETKAEAVALAEQAVKLDPDSALLWFQLQERYRVYLDLLPPAQAGTYPRLRAEAIEQVRRLQPNLPELMILEASALTEAGQFAAAETRLRQLLDSKSGLDADINAAMASFLRLTGRVSESLPYVERARRQDPFSGDHSRNLGQTLLLLGRHADARAEAALALNLEIAKPLVYEVFWSSYLSEHNHTALYGFMFSKDVPEEFSLLRDDALLGPDQRIAKRVFGLLALDDQQQQQAALRAIINDPTIPATFYSRIMAPAAAAFGDPELSLSQLPAVPSEMMWMPYMRDVRQLPAFKERVRNLGLLDYWRSTGNWGDFCKPLPNTENDFECH